jgi:hypothetical protein
VDALRIHRFRPLVVDALRLSTLGFEIWDKFNHGIQLTLLSRTCSAGQSMDTGNLIHLRTVLCRLSSDCAES